MCPSSVTRQYPEGCQTRVSVATGLSIAGFMATWAHAEDDTPAFRVRTTYWALLPFLFYFLNPFSDVR